MFKIGVFRMSLLSFTLFLFFIYYYKILFHITINYGQFLLKFQNLLIIVLALFISVMNVILFYV
jgi:hypothetical protein